MEAFRAPSFILAVRMLLMAAASARQLRADFYNNTCLNVEHLVRSAVTRKFQLTNITAPTTLRLFFHDCFVRGCDASVLLASPNSDAEKDHPIDLSLVGGEFDTAGSPFYHVVLGRRDERISTKASVENGIPLPTFDLVQLNTSFGGHGLSRTDMITQSVTRKFQLTDITAPATLRLFFHDCFVWGCDASVLLASPNNDAEKDHPIDLSLAGDGFNTVIKDKAVVDSNPQCRNKVSYADILALATRDVIFLEGGTGGYRQKPLSSMEYPYPLSTLSSSTPASADMVFPKPT
ncbi:hypothetical protein CRG98_045373 [Punica granatum]|uniref:Peroxidase n=1 Tax=Punica granatum TaxID=22663 RepID=A0A2I0HRZ8_PUNGR|nr:hypothetical protein CRG98_045373 [Punica granatum]